MVWDPYLEKDKDNLEKVDCRGAHMVKSDYDYMSSATGMLKGLGRTSLADRVRDIRLALFYKEVFDLVAIPSDTILITTDSRMRSTRDNNLTFKHIQANTQAFENSFFM